MIPTDDALPFNCTPTSNNWASSATLPPGSTASWRLTVTNTGDVSLANVTAADPAEADCEAPVGTIAVLPVGASRRFVCTTPSVVTVVTNTATATGTPPSGAPITSAPASATVNAAAAAPAVTGISPGSGPGAGGISVTITGSAFTGASAVSFGATAATSFSVGSDTRITAAAPPGTGSVDVRVTTSAGTSSATGADRYTYIPDATALSAGPIVLSIDPGAITVTLNLSATLTDTVIGHPVAGQTVTFTVEGTTVCTAVTDANGTAACHGLVPVVLALLDLHYTATFTGTPALQPATATGQLIRL